MSTAVCVTPSFSLQAVCVDYDVREGTDRAPADRGLAVSPSFTKQRPQRRSIQTSARRDTDPRPEDLNGPLCFQDGLRGTLYPGPHGPSLGADFADLGVNFPSLDGSGPVASFDSWDANLQQFSSPSLNSLAAPSAGVAPPLSTAPSVTDGREDSEDADEDQEPSEALSSQLTSLSQRATRARRRLVRPARAPLTVSSPEVNEALEDTNTLIRIVKKITAPDRDNSSLDPTAAYHGLTFSALACHQHLVALFRAICDAIFQCLQSKKEQQQLDQKRRQHSDVGPSSVAQFVMVLQLLMHLINRMDRTLFQNNPSIWHSVGLSGSGYVTPITPNAVNHRTIDPIQLEASAGGSSPPGGLLVLVQDIMGTIPNEHEKLRQVIQKLQTDMEHSELH